MQHQNEIYETMSKHSLFRCFNLTSKQIPNVSSLRWLQSKVGKGEAYQQHSIVQPHSNLCSRYLTKPFAGIFCNAAHCFMSHGEWNTKPLVSEEDGVRLGPEQTLYQHINDKLLMQKYVFVFTQFNLLTTHHQSNSLKLRPVTVKLRP